MVAFAAGVDTLQRQVISDVVSLIDNTTISMIVGETPTMETLISQKGINKWGRWRELSAFCVRGER